MLKRNNTLKITGYLITILLLLLTFKVEGQTVTDYAFYHPSNCIAENPDTDPVYAYSIYLRYDGTVARQFYCPIMSSWRYDDDCYPQPLFSFRGDTIDWAYFYVFDNGSTGNISASLCCIPYDEHSSSYLHCGTIDSTSCDGCYDYLFLDEHAYCGGGDELLFISVTMPSNAGGASRLQAYEVYANYPEF